MGEWVASDVTCNSGTELISGLYLWDACARMVCSRI